MNKNPENNARGDQRRTLTDDKKKGIWVGPQEWRNKIGAVSHFQPKKVSTTWYFLTSNTAKEGSQAASSRSKASSTDMSGKPDTTRGWGQEGEGEEGGATVALPEGRCSGRLSGGHETPFPSQKVEGPATILQKDLKTWQSKIQTCKSNYIK